MLRILGRIDYQIKLNGYRIELEEIENNIAKCDSVERAIVLVTKRMGENIWKRPLNHSYLKR